MAVVTSGAHAQSGVVLPAGVYACVRVQLRAFYALVKTKCSATESLEEMFLQPSHGHNRYGSLRILAFFLSFHHNHNGFSSSP